MPRYTPFSKTNQIRYCKVPARTSDKTNLKTKLNELLGKTISDVCPNDFHKQNNNHCAHFVSHVMGYTFGFRCKQMSGTGDGQGANIRVQEIFAKCPSVGAWDDPKKPSGSLLAFVTDKSNVKGKVMTNVPKKHIGIFCGGMIYHYSNSRNTVVSQTPTKFAKHYSGSNIGVFYGTFPAVS